MTERYYRTQAKDMEALLTSSTESSLPVKYRTGTHFFKNPSRQKRQVDLTYLL